MRRVLVLEGPGVDDRCRAWASAAGLEADLRPSGEDIAATLTAGTAGDDPPAGAVVAPAEGGFQSPVLAAAVAAATEAGVAVVAVETGNLRKGLGTDPAATAVARAGARVLYGRGSDTARYAIDHLNWRSAWPAATVAYGDEPDQIGDLRLPAAVTGPAPVAVLLHGGFWYHAWERDLMDALAVDLTRRGFATWNAEYRRVGAGGGWPATGADVAAAVDHVAAMAPVHHLDLGRVTLVGHSAGAQLALRAAAHDDPAATAVRPQLVVGLATIADLSAARAGNVGGRSVDRLLAGAPNADGASPITHLPLGVRQILVHAADDDVVPLEQSRAYTAAAGAAGDDVELVEVAGGHFALIDPRSHAWAAVAGRLGGVS